MIQKKMGGTRKALMVVRPSVIATTFSSRSEKYFKLQRINGVLAGVYLLQAILLMLLGNAMRLPVMLNYLVSDPLASAAAKHRVLSLGSHHWFDVNLLAALVVMLFLAALIHGLMATALRAHYESGLGKKMQDLRWWGYGVIGGLSVVITALVLGVSDASVLVLLFGCCVLLALGAMAMEANAKLWPWGLFAGVAAGAMGLGLGMYVLAGPVYGTALPAYAYAAAALTALGGIGAALNLYLQIRGKKEWAEYVFTEEGYLALNLVVSSAFVWVIFAGALHQ